MQHHSSQQPDRYAMRRHAATRCVRLRMLRDRAHEEWDAIHGPYVALCAFSGPAWEKWSAADVLYGTEFRRYLDTYGTPPPSTRYGLGLA